VFFGSFIQATGEGVFANGFQIFYQREMEGKRAETSDSVIN